MPAGRPFLVSEGTAPKSLSVVKFEKGGDETLERVPDEPKVVVVAVWDGVL